MSKPYVEAKEIPAVAYVPVKNTRYMNYLPEEMHRPKFPELFENPKLLIPDIIGPKGIVGTYDETGLYTNHSFNCCVRKCDLSEIERLRISESDAVLSCSYSLLYILGIINSPLSGFYFRSALGGKMHASPANIRRIPIRTINFDDPADKARHDRMVALVETMLRLKREHAAESVVFSDKRHELAEQIERTDREIDALVYELYDLTDDEIALVEGRSGG